MSPTHRHLHRRSLSGPDFGRSVKTGPGNSEVGGMRFRRPDVAAADPDRSRPDGARRRVSENGPGRHVGRSSGLRQLLPCFLPHRLPEVGLPLQLGKISSTL